MPHTYDYNMCLLAFRSVVKRAGVTLERAQASKPERLLSRDESWVLVPIFSKHRADSTYATKGTVQLCFTLNISSYLKVNLAKWCFSEFLLGKKIIMCYYE